MKVEIEFVRDLIGHDIATIEQMYGDWTQQKNIIENGAVAEEIEKLKNLIEELYMFHEDPSPNHRRSDEFSTFLKNQVEKRNAVDNANKKNNSDAAEDDDLPF
jgi:hypothetical protein